MPVFAADVAATWTTAYIDYDAKDYVACDRGDFDDGEDEFGFTIALDAEKIDDNDQYQEDGDPSVVVD